MGGGPIWPETVLYAQDLFPEQFRSLFDQKISAEEEHHPPSSLGATVNRLTRMRISCVFQVLYKNCRRMRDNSLEITCGRARCQDRNSHASPPGSWCSREQTNNPMSRLPFSHLHILIEFQCTMVLAIEIKERKICKSKWLDFTHFSTNYYFFGLYCCETAKI